MERKKLSDILKNGAKAPDLQRLFHEAKPADDFGRPLPRGEYIARVVSGELFSSRENETPGFKLTFSVVEGEFAGRNLWLDIWLTGPAMPMAKRDLGKLGVNDLNQLEKPVPPGIVCQLKVVVRRNDGGDESNVVRSFEVLRIEPTTADVFAPAMQETIGQ